MSHRSDFVDRHIGPNQYQVQTMLLELGFKDLDSFISGNPFRTKELFYMFGINLTF